MSSVCRDRMLLLFICLGSSACFRFPLKTGSSESPVEVVSVDTEFGEKEGAVKARLKFQNSRNLSAQVRDIDWELRIDGRQFATGIESIGAKIKPRANEEVAFEAALAYEDVDVKNERATLQVIFKGQLTVVDDADVHVYPFQRSLSVVSAGRPMLRSLQP